MLKAETVLQGRYRVEKQIGEGGMGAVYVATDERFGSMVAVKETFFNDEHLTKAFEREAKLLNSLRHPALPRVSDYFIEGNGKFLVMEYIAGEDLAEMLENRGTAFPVEDVLKWADQLLDALDYLHTQEMPVIHRDIKPQNLKLTSRGQIILLDFGLAKGNPTNPESATAAKSVFGFSRNYASLEQIQGTGTDPRSDLYSLAATLYNLVTGTPPADALMRAMNVLSGEKDILLSADEINPRAGKNLSDVLNRAMDLNSGNRPASAAAMRQLLHRSEKDTPALSSGTLQTASPESLHNQKTEVLPTNAPQSLKITESASFSTVAKTDSAETVQTRGKRGGIFAGVVLASVLATGAAASGIYYYKPEIFGFSANSNVEKTTEISQPSTENKTFSANVSETKIESQTPIIATETRTNEVKKENPTTGSPVEKKNSEPPPSVSKDLPKDAKQTVKTVTPKQPESPQVKSPENNIVSRPTQKEPENVEAPPTVQTPKDKQIITPEQYRQMTPRQKKRLKQIIINRSGSNNKY